MKRLFLLLATFALIATGCKGGNQKAADNQDSNLTETAEADTEAAAGDGFSFDELYRILSIFGDNIMSEKFASKAFKESIKDDLKENYSNYLQFIGPCNFLAHTLYEGDGDSLEDFEMACYRYAADGHVLVLLSENAGGDVFSNKYFRAYDYNPESNDAHEIEPPFNPQLSRDDFEDLVRLAGADVASLRAAMKAGQYIYEYRADGLKVRLNDPTDFDDQIIHGDLYVDYLWDGSEFVRNKDYRYACIHGEGFGNILLGQPAPDFHFDYDPLGYKVTYSGGGDLWIIDLKDEETLQVQMENGKVYSVETWSPRYSVAKYFYDCEPLQQPYVGARINDCIDFDDEALQVKMLMDGTVQIEVDAWNSKIAFRTSSDSLANPVKPSFNGPDILENAKFKPDARIESILLWRDL